MAKPSRPFNPQPKPQTMDRIVGGPVRPVVRPSLTKRQMMTPGIGLKLGT